MKLIRSVLIVSALVFSAILLAGPHHADAESGATLEREAKASLQKLLKKSIKAKALAHEAKGILVFPKITKGGFIVGGQYGEGVLFRRGKASGYYSTVAGSFGLQAGIQEYGYALFFMTDAALRYLDKSEGWELGTAPNIVILDVGAASSLSTTTVQSDMFAFFFDEKGLMAGLGFQGTKITKIKK